jgi:Na+/H+-dicarboxylate symporter
LPFCRLLYVQVLCAIALGALLGHFAPAWGASLSVTFTVDYWSIGQTGIAGTFGNSAATCTRP